MGEVDASAATVRGTTPGSSAVDPHQGGGFNPPNPTTRGGPDYARFIEAVRTISDHARAVDAPDDVIAKAADLLEDVSAVLAPYDADEWASPSGRRMDLPDRGNALNVPTSLRKTDDGRIGGGARFRRFHLGRNSAAHGGTVAMMFDAVLGFTAAHLTGNLEQRTAYLHVNYRDITPIEKELQIDAGIERIDGRKIFVEGRLSDGDRLLADAHALFVRLRPGQP